MMVKKAFRMKLYDGMAEEYKRRHDALWPEMVDMIHRYGGHNYSIWLDEATGDLFGCLELESEELWAKSASDPVCRRWWDYMADVMETNSDNSPCSADLACVFNLL